METVHVHVLRSFLLDGKWQVDGRLDGKWSDMYIPLSLTVIQELW